MQAYVNKTLYQISMHFNRNEQLDGFSFGMNSAPEMFTEETFLDIAKQLPVGIIVLCMNRRIEYCNPAILAMLGYKDEEMIGTDICQASLFRQEGQGCNLSCPEIFDLTQEPLDFEQVCVTKEGKEISTEWKVIPVSLKKKDRSRIICCINCLSVDGNSRYDPEDYDKKYVRVLENAYDGIVIIQNFVIKYINPKITEITGYDRTEIIGKNFMNFISSESKEDAYRMYVEMKKDIVDQNNSEVNIMSKSGNKIPMRILSSGIYYQGSAADLVILQDVSEKRRSEKQLERYSEELQKSNILVRRKLELERSISFISSVLVAPEDLNDAIEKCLGNIGVLCGASRVYLFMIKDEVMDNTHEWCNEGVEPQKDNLKDLPVDMFPWWMKKLHLGEIIHVTDVSAMPSEASSEKEILEMQGITSLIVLPLYVGGKMSGFVGMDNVVNTGSWSEDDIKVLGILSNLLGSAIERRHNEEALRSHSLELEKAYAELKTHDRMKSEFLANLSHELKTPLNSIYGYSTLLNEEVLGTLNESQRKSVDAVVLNSERLGALIDSLLYMGNVLAGSAKYTFDMVLAESIIDRTMKNYSDPASKKGVELFKRVELPHPFLEADVNFLMKLMDNIMDNAVKFTPAGGKIVLSVYEDGDHIHFAVRDTGIGISQGNFKYIFDSFYQADGSSTRKYGGNGLGLYIAKLIVDAHHGRIWIESETEIGTTVHILLPKKQALG